MLTIAGCATRPAPVAVAPVAPPVLAYAPPPVPPVPPVPLAEPAAPAMSAINRGLSPAATVWHLRVALNVAALACRGPAESTIVADYNALLARHRDVLAKTEAALAAEYRALGGDWRDTYDDAMTRLYNFFSQAQVRDAFCATAAQVLVQTRGLAPGEVGESAAPRLAAIDAPFASGFPPTPLPAQMIAAAPPPAPPIAAPVASAATRPAPGIVLASVAE